jgi:hypothetical protein
MAFVERSLSLLSDDGLVALLLPSKMTSADYASAVRRLLSEDALVVEMHDWSTEGRSLFAADVFPLGVVASRLKSGEPVRFHTKAEAFVIERSELAVGRNGSAWSTLPPDVRRTARWLRGRHATLEEVLGRRPVMGVKTGANARFFLDEVVVSDGGVSVASLGMRLPAEAVVRAVRGRDVRRWAWTDSTWMLWPAGFHGDLALARALARKLGVTREALRLSYVRSEHLGLKVAWKDVSRGLAAAVLPDRTLIDGMWFSVVPNQTLYSLDVATKDEGYVLAALLNSTVANALALETAERAKDHHWRYQASGVASLPIPRVDTASEAWRALIRVARRAVAGDEDGRELNKLVAGLYGIDSNELEQLERFVDARLGRSGVDRG